MKPLGNLLGFAVAWLVFIAVTMGVGLVLIPVYWALTLRGLTQREAKAQEKLQSILMDHEKILVSAIQQRLCSLTDRRELIAITNSRLILMTRSIFGGFAMKDHQWKDLRDAALVENMLPNLFGSRLSFAIATGAESIVIDGIESAMAARVYSQAQSQEQAWEEKRRVRDLEEKRAASGGMMLHGATAAGPGGARNGASLEELGKAKQLFDSGAISDAEYQEIKAKILAGGAF